MTETCTFCNSDILKSIASYENHINNSHNILKNQQLIISLFLLDEVEMNDILTRLQPRIETLKESESSPTIKISNVRSRDDIKKEVERPLEETEQSSSTESNYFVENQSQLELGDEDSVDGEEDDSNIDASIIDNDLETTVQPEEEVNKSQPSSPKVTKDDIKNESMNDGSDNTSDIDINSINLVEKFKEANQCKLCYTKCPTDISLSRHEKVVHSNDQSELALSHFTLSDLQFPCDGCPGVRFLSENILIVHTKIQHGKILKPTTKPCKVCGKTFKTPQGLSSHLPTHKVFECSDRPFSCKLCYCSYKRKDVLQAHISKVHVIDAEFLNIEVKEEDKIHSCSNCSLRFVSTNSRDYHQKRNHPMKRDDSKEFVSKAEATFKCFFCDVKFITPKYRKDHCYEIHGKKDEFVEGNKIKCMVCKGIVKKVHLNKHRRKHFEESIPCKLCALKYKKSNLKSHQERMHVSVEEKKFLETGEGEFNFECLDCGNKFMTKSSCDLHSLRAHLLKEDVKVKIKKEKPTFDKSLKVECELCFTKLNFNNKRRHELRIHKSEEEQTFLSTKVGKFNINCAKCEKKFITESSLVHHQRVHSEFTCTYCNSVFFERNVYKCHILAVHKVKNKTGRRCNLCYKEVGDVYNHKKTVHAAEKEFLVRKISDEDLKFQCSKCQYKFVSQEILNAHQRQHEYEDFEFLKTTCLDKDTSKFQCCLCFTKIKSFSHMTRHAMIYHKDEMDLLKTPPTDKKPQNECQECGLKTFTENSLLFHRLKEHYGVQDSTCKLCNVTFKNKTGAFSHRVKVHRDELEILNKVFDENERNRRCVECPKKYFTESSLSYHKRKSHVKKKKKNIDGTTQIKINGNNLKAEIRCKLCYTKFKKNVFLKIHTKNLHSKELHLLEKDLGEDDLVVECDLCDKKFATNNSQKLHRNKHDVIFECFFCPDKLDGRVNLLNHCKKVHGKEDERIDENHFKCMVCEKDYLKDRINAHRMIHNKNNPFQCQLCNKKFNHRNYLTIHQKSHKGETDNNRTLKPSSSAQSQTKLPTDCNLCHYQFTRYSALKVHRQKIHTSQEEISMFKVGVIEDSKLKQKCKFCQKMFFNVNSLKHHQISSHRTELERNEISCEFCGRIFKWKNRGNLKIHMNKIHSVSDYDVNEHSLKKPEESNTVNNFLNFLTSLQ